MKDVRATALRARREMPVAEREIASALICDRVIRCREFTSAKLVACYFPMRDEVDTRAIIERAWRANKRIFIPVLRKQGEMSFREIRPESLLERNSFGIWEPASGAYASARDLHIAITPTVAFDEKNHRIGMGGGYYDRCFSFLRNRRHWFRPKLIGVAFDCQKVEEISPNTWDIRLYRVISEAR